MRLISIFSYNFADNFANILSICKLVVIFPEQSDLFRIVKNYMNAVYSNLTFFIVKFCEVLAREGKSLSASLQHCEGIQGVKKLSAICLLYF